MKRKRRTPQPDLFPAPDGFILPDWEPLNLDSWEPLPEWEPLELGEWEPVQDWEPFGMPAVDWDLTLIDWNLLPAVW